MLKSISISNYKSFIKKQTLKIKPITLIFGENNAGKSALIRLLPLISDSIQISQSAINLESLAIKGASLDELKNNKTKNDIEIELEFENSSISYTITNETYHKTNTKQPTISKIKILNEDEELELTKIANTTQDYTKTNPSSDEIYQIDFLGIIANQITSQSNQEEAIRIQKILNTQHQRDLKNQIKWLGTNRQLHREYSSKNTSTPAVKLDKDRSALAEVREFYKKAFKKQLDPNGSENISIKILNAATQSHPINIIDCGESLSQTFPIVSEIALSSTSDDNQYIVIEEPESHLHPNTREILGQYICTQIQKNTNKNLRVILETHSEEILLAIQTAVLQKIISNKDVAIYWLYTPRQSNPDTIEESEQETYEESGSILEEVEMGEDGLLNTEIISSAFEVTLKMATKILSPQ